MKIKKTKTIKLDKENERENLYRKEKGFNFCSNP